MTVELKKLGKVAEKSVSEMDRKEGWAVFMEYYRVREDPKTGIIKTIMHWDDGTAAADRVMTGFTETELEKIAAMAKEKFELDAKEERFQMRDAARAEGREEGLAEGRAEGREEAMKDMARKLKAMGIPQEKIIEVCGLSIPVIEDL